MPESPRKASKPRRRTPRRTYHHGDLRQALLDAALEILRTKGVEALTLRAVARAAGVSQTAPYRHFADRRSLV
ncbi:MAG TPA: helix-turn-helix domain-containing protein, partial [Gemmatimonadaceae bacterium]|nr:helix-turn-helix domain-containing protein [Gemmatimonadaceae bacterium]